MNRQMFNALCAQYATPEVSGDGLVSWDGGKKCVIPSVKLYGAAVQDGEPTPDAPIMPVCNNGVFVARGRNLVDLSMFELDDSAYAHTYYPSPEFIAAVSALTGRTITYSAMTTGTTTAAAKIGRLTFMVGSNRVFIVEPGRSYVVPDLSGITMVLYYGSYAGATVKDLQWEIGGTATPYTPYYDGGQAQAPELWAIPGTEYRDEWNPQTGRGVRAVARNALDGVTRGKKFVSVHNTLPADVFVVEQELMYLSSDLYGIQNVAYILSNYFKFATGYYRNEVYAFKKNVASWGIVCALPYSMFGISKGEKTNDELLELANNWLAEKEEEGSPLIWWYPLATPKPFYHPPAKLTMPTGYGQIIQVSGDVPDCPISAKYLTHS